MKFLFQKIAANAPALTSLASLARHVRAGNCRLGALRALHELLLTLTHILGSGFAAARRFYALILVDTRSTRTSSSLASLARGAYGNFCTLGLDSLRSLDTPCKNCLRRGYLAHALAYARACTRLRRVGVSHIASRCEMVGCNGPSGREGIPKRGIPFTPRNLLKIFKKFL